MGLYFVDRLEAVIERDMLDVDALQILSEFMSSTKSIVIAAQELMKYSENGGTSSSLISERFSLTKHFEISARVREKMNIVNAGNENE
jgi:hypothetical protein